MTEFSGMEEKKMLRRLGRKIRHLRKEKNWTGSDLSKLCLISVDRIEEIEKGEINLRFHTMVRIAEAFQISVAELLKNKPRCD